MYVSKRLSHFEGVSPKESIGVESSVEVPSMPTLHTTITKVKMQLNRELKAYSTIWSNAG